MENETQTETTAETSENTAEATQVDSPIGNEVEEVVEAAEEAHEASGEIENVHVDETPVKTISGSPLEPTKKLEAVELLQSKMSTPFIIIFLILVFVILKSFIYTKDDERHGK